jgi:hypothetical protein
MIKKLLQSLGIVALTILLSATVANAANNLYQNNNNVGIGTTTPNWPLQVASTSPYVGITNINAGVNLKHWLISNQGGTLQFGTSTDALTSTSSLFTFSGSTGAKFGIGTSTLTEALTMPGGSIDLGNPALQNGTLIFYRGGTTNTTQDWAGSAAGNSGTIGLSGREKVVINIDSDSSQPSTLNFFSVRKNKGAIDTLTTSELFRVQQDFRSGFGTTSPWGTLSVSTTTASANALPLFVVGSSANATLFNVQTGGNVGVGTTSPFTTFSVVGNSYLNGTLTVTGLADGCVNITSGLLGSTGSACGAGGGSAYPFPLAGNATSTLTQFNGGLTAYASSTISFLTVTLGTTTNATSTTLSTATLGVGTDYITDITGSGILNTAGALTLDRTGAWTGTFDSQEGTWYQDRANHTGTQLASTITGATFGSGSFIFPSGTLTSLGSTTLQNFTASNGTTTNATSTTFNTGTLGVGTDYITDITGSGILNTAGALTLDRTGAWTGTFDSQEGTWYQDRANHTGTQLASTITGATFGSGSFIFPSGSLTSLGSTTLQNFTATNGTTTNATSTNLAVTSITSGLHLADANGLITKYAGTSCTNQFVRSLSALGAATCATVGSADVSLAALTAGAGLTSAGTYTGATARTFDFDFTRADTWTGLHQFQANASTTMFSSYGPIFIGSTATSTLQGTATGTSTLQGFLNVTGTNSTSTFSGALTATYLNLTGSNATNTAATGINIASGCFAVNNVCVGAGNRGTITDSFELHCDASKATSTRFFIGGATYMPTIYGTASTDEYTGGAWNFANATSSEVDCHASIPKRISGATSGVLKLNYSSATSTSKVAVMDVQATTTTPQNGTYNPSKWTTLRASTTAGDRIATPSATGIGTTSSTAMSSITLVGGDTLFVRLTRWGKDAADTQGDIFFHNDATIEFTSQ